MGSAAPRAFDSISSTIESFAAGNFIVVLDDTDRENEGDLIIAAEDMTTEKMAFMVRYSSGLICTPVTPAIADKMELRQMIELVDSQDPNRTAYTISIDAADSSVTTGISAQDRALTCRVLANKKAAAADLRRPGHVFPLRARKGGVRERTGHTEAAVEFCRLTGKQQVGVISEIVDEGDEIPGEPIRINSGMLRRDGCLEFGRKYGLKVCTIADLVQYVEKKEGKLLNGST